MTSYYLRIDLYNLMQRNSVAGNAAARLATGQVAQKGHPLAILAISTFLTSRHASKLAIVDLLDTPGIVIFGVDKELLILFEASSTGFG